MPYGLTALEGFDYSSSIAATHLRVTAANPGVWQVTYSGRLTD